MAQGYAEKLRQAAHWIETFETLGQREQNRQNDSMKILPFRQFCSEGRLGLKFQADTVAAKPTYTFKFTRSGAASARGVRKQAPTAARTEKIVLRIASKDARSSNRLCMSLLRLLSEDARSSHRPCMSLLRSLT